MFEKRKLLKIILAAIFAIVIGVGAGFAWFGYRLWQLYLAAPFVAVPIVSDSQDKEAVKMLFIGNSLTFQHMVPAAVSAFIENNLKKPARVWQVVVPGQTLDGHWKTKNAQLQISKGPWDYVILQPGSGEVFYNFESLRLNAKQFDKLIKDAHAKTVLFETFADKSQTQDQQIITKAYKQLGQELNAQVIPVGQAFFFAQAKDASFDLYEEDKHHPSQCGTFLASCIIFEYLFDKDPRGLPAKVVFRTPKVEGEFTAIDLSKDQEQRIENIAWEFYKQNRPQNNQ